MVPYVAYSGSIGEQGARTFSCTTCWFLMLHTELTNSKSPSHLSLVSTSSHSLFCSVVLYYKMKRCRLSLGCSPNFIDVCSTGLQLLLLLIRMRQYVRLLESYSQRAGIRTVCGTFEKMSLSTFRYIAHVILAFEQAYQK